jgi:hypothetical protein
MSLNFPSSPITGETYQTGSSPNYIYNGNYWEIDKNFVANGSSGTSGTSGSSGTNGGTGSSGTSGSSGGTGSSGTSGTSGYVDNDWLFFTPSTSTIASTGNNFVLSGTTTSNGSVSYNQSTGIITLAANKTYKLDASLALANSASNSEISYQWINVTNSNTVIGNAGAVLVNKEVAPAAWQSMASAIIVTTGTTQVALRSVFSNSTGGLNVGMCRFIVNQINGWSGSSGTSGSNGSNGTSGSSGSSGSSGTSVLTTVTGTTSTGDLNVGGNQTVTGSATFRGITRFETVGGDEGGEIQFGVPVTNTTLQNRVTVDVWQNRLRFFEGSANANGVYIDLSKPTTGNNNEITYKASGIVNAGTFVTLDNIKATVTTSGQRGLSLATVSGTIAINMAGNYAGSGVGVGGSSGTASITTSASTSLFGWGFTATGDFANYIITDTTNSRAYRIIIQIGLSFNNNLVSIERLH